MILATWQGLPASLLQGWARKGVYPDGCGRPGTGRVAPFATYSNMSISQYTRLMCISYGVPGKDRVNFMSVFQIGVKLIALQGERMGVVLGRLLEPRRDAEGRGELQNCFFIHEGPRRDTKDTFLSAENCFFHEGTRRDTENTFFSTSVLRVVDRWLAPFDQYCAEPQSFLVFAVPCPDFSESRRA